jgi:hypothetical protein
VKRLDLWVRGRVCCIENYGYLCVYARNIWVCEADISRKRYACDELIRVQEGEEQMKTSERKVQTRQEGRRRKPSTQNEKPQKRQT